MITYLTAQQDRQTLQLHFPLGAVLAALPLSSLLDLMFQLHWHLDSHILTSYLPLKNPPVNQCKDE